MIRNMPYRAHSKSAKKVLEGVSEGCSRSLVRGIVVKSRSSLHVSKN